MADQDGLDACKQAYQAAIVNCNSILISNLGTATTDADKQVAIDEFKKAIQLCKDALQQCDAAFS